VRRWKYLLSNLIDAPFQTLDREFNCDGVLDLMIERKAGNHWLRQLHPQDWRNTLKIGDLVWCMDTQDTTLPAEIIKRQESQFIDFQDFLYFPVFVGDMR